MRKFLTLFLASFVALAIWTAPSYAEVSFGGELRIRAESWLNQDFSDDKNSYDSTDCSLYGSGCDQRAFIGQRARLWGMAKPTDDTTIKLTIQDTRYWGEYGQRAYNNGGPSLTDEWENVTDLHEAWLQIDNFFNTGVAFKIGRQELVYGDQRLVGNFGWSNYGRSFDAAKFMYGSDQFDVDFWYSKISDSTAAQFEYPFGPANSAADEDQDFYGIYGTLKTIPNNTLDLYVMYLRDGSPFLFVENPDTPSLGTPNITMEEQNLWTYGARLKGDVAGVDYTVEVPFQTGEITDKAALGTDYDISAWAWAARAGYTIPNAPVGLRIGAEYVFAQGDDDDSDGDINTFSNLFPTNHSHMGFMDQQGWRNVKAWNVNVAAKPVDKLSARLDYWDFRLDETADAWYGAGAWMNQPTGMRSACTGASPSCDEHVGSEVDLTLNYAYNKAVGIQAGVSRFFVGDFIEDALGTSDVDDMDWAYLQFTANF